MADYKAMYYRLAGQMDTIPDVLEANTTTLGENSITLEMASVSIDELIENNRESMKVNHNSLEIVSKTLKAAYKSIEKTNGALMDLNRKIKAKLLETEEMYIKCEDENTDD